MDLLHLMVLSEQGGALHAGSPPKNRVPPRPLLVEGFQLPPEADAKEEVRFGLAGLPHKAKAQRWPIDRHAGGSLSGDFFVSSASLQPRPGPAPPDEARWSPRWLSIRDIASDLGVSVYTAYKWSARGGPWFPRSIRLRNGDIRVRRDWYEQWLAEHESR